MPATHAAQVILIGFEPPQTSSGVKFFPLSLKDFDLPPPFYTLTSNTLNEKARVCLWGNATYTPLSMSMHVSMYVCLFGFSGFSVAEGGR